MAMNPMQRRSRNSFYIGFLVALILMALVVAALVMKMKAINEEKEALLQKQITVYVAANDLKSGETVTLEEDFMMSTVQTTLDQSQIISDEDFQYLDEEGNIVTYAATYDKKGESLELQDIETDAEWNLIENLLSNIEEASE